MVYLLLHQLIVGGACYEKNGGNGKGQGDSTPKDDNCCRNIAPGSFEPDEINNAGYTVTSV